MSTISTEQAKDLRNAFECWQQDYDPVEDKEQYEMFGLGVVAMDELLALRKEREAAVPAIDLWNRWADAEDKIPHALPVAVPDEHYQNLSELYHAQEKRLFKLAQRIKGHAFDKYSHSSSQAIDVLEAAIFGESDEACRAAMLNQAQPVAETYTTSQQFESLAGKAVVPEGWKLVPMRLTAENGAKGALSGEFSETKFVNCHECFGDGECETCDGSGRIEITVPVTWSTIKEIWAKGVEHFATSPQSPGNDHATVSGRWIPCSERMPVEKDIVLVVDDGYFVCEAQYREGDFFSAARGSNEFFETICRDVEFWQPLPEPPCK